MSFSHTVDAMQLMGWVGVGGMLTLSLKDTKLALIVCGVAQNSMSPTFAMRSIANNGIFC